MKFLIGCIIVSLLFLGSCSENIKSPSNGEGRLKIFMTDSPADYDEVNIVVERVEVHHAGAGTEGWFIINNQTAVYNLLELRNGASVVLGENFLEAGHYTQIRLIIGEGSNIVIDGQTYPLEIPSGTQTGVKLIHQFTIEPNITYELMLDFEVEKSVVVTGNGKFLLKPTIRVIPVAMSGSISGFILPVEAESVIETNFNGETIQTFINPDGYFKIFVEQKSDYSIHIKPHNPIFKDKMISEISVSAGQNTDLGVIILTP